MSSAHDSSTDDSANVTADVFVCDCEKWGRSACEKEAFYGELGGRQYCVLHYPALEKKVEFDRAIDKKLNNKDFNFRGVWFPSSIWLSGFVFGAKVDFYHAVINGDFSLNKCTFTAETDFTKASFNAKADFSDGTFNATAKFSLAEFGDSASFEHATFKEEADFSQARFSSRAVFTSSTFIKKADFSKTIFDSDAGFSLATFHGETEFSHATFKDHVNFVGNELGEGFNASLNLQHAQIERPERIYFHSLTLLPNWFVDVDCSNFAFINVEWRDTTPDVGDRTREGGGTRTELSRKRVLAVAYRHLAINAEENHRYEEASRFRYKSMDLQRRSRWRGLALWRLDWWYWVASREEVFKMEQVNEEAGSLPQKVPVKDLDDTAPSASFDGFYFLVKRLDEFVNGRRGHFCRLLCGSVYDVVIARADVGESCPAISALRFRLPAVDTSSYQSSHRTPLWLRSDQCPAAE